jgi:peptidoglycan/xylan/chitin deacetylase (PgdA/CDA1 family)
MAGDPRTRRFRGPTAAVSLLALLLAACSAAPSPTAGPSATAPSTAPSADVPESPSATASGRPSAAPSPTTSPEPPTSPDPVVHVVEAGDSLFSIARRYGTTARSIAYWNGVTYPTLDPRSPAYDPDRIEVGWRLVVHPGSVVDEADPPPGPSAPPTSSAAPPSPPVLPPTPTPRPDGASLVVAAGPRGGNAVALTFDMGGRLDPAGDIVDWLIEHDVPATVFPTGTSASGTAVGRTVMARIAAHPDLLGVGNHTWDHPDLAGLDGPAIEAQLVRAEAVIDEAVGRTSRPFFRPPYGSHDAEVREVAGRLGWAYTVMWDVDTVDWQRVEDGGPTADDIVARVLARARGGSIVLMHLGGYHTLEALPRIVEGLRDRGLEPVTLGAMFGS